MTVDAVGDPAFPPVLTGVPWATVVPVAAATGAVISAVVVLLSRALARLDLSQVLRAGEDA